MNAVLKGFKLEVAAEASEHQVILSS